MIDAQCDDKWAICYKWAIDGQLVILVWQRNDMLATWWHVWAIRYIVGNRWKLGNWRYVFGNEMMGKQWIDIRYANHIFLNYDAERIFIIMIIPRWGRSWVPKSGRGTETLERHARHTQVVTHIFGGRGRHFLGGGGHWLVVVVSETGVSEGEWSKLTSFLSSWRW